MTDCDICQRPLDGFGHCRNGDCPRFDGHSDVDQFDCDICQEAIEDGQRKVEWGRSPWGDGDGWAHFSCADNWEPTDEQLEAHNNAGYPTLRERQEAAWEQKRKLHR